MYKQSLYDAVCKGDGAEVSRILDANPKVLNAVIYEEKQAAVLHCAVEKSPAKTRTQIVQQLLLRKNIDVNMRNVNGSTPLYYASFFGRVNATKLLLEHKARIDMNRKVSHTV